MDWKFHRREHTVQDVKEHLIGTGFLMRQVEDRM